MVVMEQKEKRAGAREERKEGIRPAFEAPYGN
jgi:hypothetical protein